MHEECLPPLEAWLEALRAEREHDIPAMTEPLTTRSVVAFPLTNEWLVEQERLERLAAEARRRYYDCMGRA